MKNLTIEFLEDVMGSRSILPTEHKAASQLYHMITREEPVRNRVTLDRLLAPPLVSRTTCWRRPWSVGPPAGSTPSQNSSGLDLVPRPVD